ncbi:MAG: hypothetical protein GEU98_00270 [Pseudonocardiaceae bacterium]|nr:hypothetical protein [Pseudonocardiaceae bacterium]
MRASEFGPRRLLIVGVCVLCLVACCLLAWWQWQRFSSTGSFLNLGYVLQWPLFGLFPAFMFWRLRNLRKQHEQQEQGEHPGAAETAAPERTVPRPRLARTYQHVAAGPDDEDLEDRQLAEYNRYLAELNAARPPQRR